MIYKGIVEALKYSFLFCVFNPGSFFWKGCFVEVMDEFVDEIIFTTVILGHEPQEMCYKV